MMFRPLKGFKAQYHDLTLLVAADFDEYRVFIQAPGSIVQGRRQFNEEKAKEHAFSMALSYLKEKESVQDAAPPAPQWIPFASAEWLAWNP
jgi:hypothetical protein